MIPAQAIRIDQSFRLDKNQVDNFLVFRMPDGLEIKAPIDDAITRRIMSMASVGWPEPPEETQATPTQELAAPDVDVLSESQPLPESDEPTYAWADLPENSLSTMMKAAFQALDAPAEMSASQIQMLINEVSEKFTQDDWAKVASYTEQAEPLPPPPKKPQRAPAPPIGQPQWADGSPVMAQPKPARTVQADDMGYPIVDGQDIDPGEAVASGDMDEDGVGQL